MMRATAWIVLLIGAAGSAGLTLYAGRHNPSHLLIAMFVIWVIAPFIALGWAAVASQRWPVLTRTTLYGAMPAVSVCSLAIYSAVALGPPRAKPAFIFLVTPPALALLGALAVAAAASISRRKS